MTYREIAAWLERQWRGVKPAAVATIAAAPFDDGLIELDRLLRSNDLRPPKSLPPLWP